MNELIEKLTNRFEIECHLSFDCIEREKFEQAIQTACKEQCNACLRIYESNWERQYMTKLIKNAEIREEDYE